MPARGRPWNTLRAQLKEQWRREGRACALCRKRIDYDAPAGHPDAFTLDHITPTSLGGAPLALSNLRACCARCNSSRGNSTRGSFPSSRAW